MCTVGGGGHLVFVHVVGEQVGVEHSTTVPALPPHAVQQHWTGEDCLQCVNCLPTLQGHSILGYITHSF